MQGRGLLLKEPVGRQLQLQEDRYTGADESKQRQEIVNENRWEEARQLPRPHRNFPKSMKDDKLMKHKEANEYSMEGNDGLEKVWKCSFSLVCSKF